MKCNKIDKQTSLDEMKEVSTLAPLSDGRMERCELKLICERQSRATHLACLSELSNSEGQRWEQNRKERDCVKSSWEGRTRERAETEAETDCSFFVTVL